MLLSVHDVYALTQLTVLTVYLNFAAQQVVHVVDVRYGVDVLYASGIAKVNEERYIPTTASVS